jgi:hypothetical protein
MSDWKRDIPDIPDDAVTKAEEIEASLRPLLKQLEHGAESALILSESAVLGE